MSFILDTLGAVRNFFVPKKVDAVSGAAPKAFSGVSGKIDSGSSTRYTAYPQVGQYAPGTSGLSKLVSSAKDAASAGLSAGSPGSPGSPVVYYGGGSGASVADPVSDKYNYYNAKLASIYKMNAETAYHEALANTSYQRAVEDLKAAGLNPVLAMGKVSGADSFYGTLDAPYASLGGGSGGFGRRSYSGASSAKSGLQKALKDYNIRNGVSSVVSGITMAATKNFQAGAAAYYFSNAFLNAAAKR